MNKTYCIWSINGLGCVFEGTHGQYIVFKGSKKEVATVKKELFKSDNFVIIAYNKNLEKTIPGQQYDEKLSEKINNEIVS